MSATIAPPRPTERAAAGTPSPTPHAGGRRLSRPGRPALRLVAGSALQSCATEPSDAATEVSGSTAGSMAGSMAGSHLRLVRDSAPAQQPASGRRRPRPAGPSSAIAPTTDAVSSASASSPATSFTTSMSASAARPAGRAEHGPSLPVEVSRRPGTPLSLRSDAQGSAGGGAQDGTGRHALGAQPSPGSRPSRVGKIDEMERLAPSHPAVRAARRRTRQVGTAPASGRRAGMAQHAERRGAAHPGRANRSAQEARTARAERTGTRAAALMSLPVPVRRFVAALGACMVAIVLVAGAVAASGLVAPQTTQTTTAVVQPGQSLWEIASATGTTDVSQTMDTIVELNGLEDSTVHAGQQLTVPVH